MKRIFFLFCTFLLISCGFAQTGQYTRKSISFIDKLFFTQENIHLTYQEEKYLLSSLHDKIRISRFDYNPLPDKIQESFKNQVTKKGTISESELNYLINKNIVPEIIKILDIQKEIRARNLVNEVQRNSFIALKAKEIGITAQQLEQVMNASFLYVPFLEEYNEVKEKNSKEIQTSLKGGLIWYHIIAGGNPHVIKVKTITSTGFGSSENSKQESFQMAVQTLTLNLQVLTRQMDIFKLQAPIVEVTNRIIKFSLGKSEGIKMDDPFYVAEWIESEDGNVSLQKLGFVRIGEVANNTQTFENFSDPGQLSTAWAVKKGDWARGMMIIEHPRLGIDIAMKPRLFNMDISEGYFGTEFFYLKFDDYTGNAGTVDIDLQLNIADLVKRSQTFFVAGISAGIVPVRTKIDKEFLIFESTTERIASSVFSGYVGLMKKRYFGPAALHGEALFGIQRLAVSDYYLGKEANIYNNSTGGRINLGLEYTVNIDCNVGIFAGLNIFPPMDWWTVEYGDDEIDIIKLGDKNSPEISTSGFTYGLYIHYSLPVLPFNPLAFLQNHLK
jgi:hypothetical protein